MRGRPFEGLDSRTPQTLKVLGETQSRSLAGIWTRGCSQQWCCLLSILCVAWQAQSLMWKSNTNSLQCIPVSSVLHEQIPLRQGWPST